MKRAQILAAFYQIADANQWHRHHKPRNLAAAIAVEAGELLAHFQWDESQWDESQRGEADDGEAERQRIGAEIADIYMYLLVLTDKLGLDLDTLTAAKIAENRRRFLDTDTETDAS